MRRKILNGAQEAWLIAHYREKSNEALAAELTKMVQKEYEKEAEACRNKLEQRISVTESIKVLARLETLNTFSGISAAYVMRVAKELGCGKKSAHYISMRNREKAEKEHWRRMAKEADIVGAPFEWLRLCAQHKVRIGKFATLKQYNSFRISLCTWNQVEGQKQGICLVPAYYKKDLMVKITTTKTF